METIEKFLKELAALGPSDGYKKYGDMLKTHNVKHGDVVKTMINEFGSKKSMGLDEAQKLVIFEIFRRNSSVHDALKGHFSEATKAANKKLFEEVGVATTTTANVAAYPVPLGTLYRQWLGSPKKKRKDDKRK